MSEGQDIVEAVKGIKGTSIANIEPNREHKEGKKPVIPGISNFNGQLKESFLVLFVVELFQALENGMISLLKVFINQ